jgi:hypothetical protein
MAGYVCGIHSERLIYDLTCLQLERTASERHPGVPHFADENGWTTEVVLTVNEAFGCGCDFSARRFLIVF